MFTVLRYCFLLGSAAGFLFLCGCQTAVAPRDLGVHTGAEVRPIACEIFVAPNGDDQLGTGSFVQPYASVAAALAAVRSCLERGSGGDIHVVFRGGQYPLDETWVIDGSLSGSGSQSIVYRAHEGEHPVFSGGFAVTDWDILSNGMWVAELPADVKPFRNLYVNGRRAQRARFPNLSDEEPYMRIWGSALDLTNQIWTLDLSAPLPGRSRPGLDDLEICVFGDWEVTWKKVASFEHTRLIMKPPHVQGHSHIHPKSGMAVYAENALQFLDQPGEWYYDRGQRTLHYWPLDGEQISGAYIIVPQLERLLVLDGVDEGRIRNVHFRGLTFRHSAYGLMAQGYHGLQATYAHTAQGVDYRPRSYARIPAAIEMRGAEYCSFVLGELSHTGAGGIDLYEQVIGNQIEGNHIHDIGGNGVSVGGRTFQTQSPATMKQNVIVNNVISQCGQVFKGGVGVWLGLTAGNVVTQNRIFDMPYTGVSAGWSWRSSMTGSGGHTITGNHIHDVMRILSDGGGIYTLGDQPLTRIHSNLIHAVHRSDDTANGAPNNGFFLDQGTSRLRVSDNVVYDVTGRYMSFNIANPDRSYFGRNYFGSLAFTNGLLHTRALLLSPRAVWYVPVSASLNTPRFSVTCWVKPAELDEEGVQHVLRFGALQNLPEHIFLQLQGAEVHGGISTGPGAADVWSLRSGDAFVRQGEWAHVALTYDHRELRLFVDGQLVGGRHVGLRRTGGRGPLLIGGRFDGAVDDVRVYGRALEADVIAQLARLGDGARQAERPTAEDTGGASRFVHRGILMDPMERGLLFRSDFDDMAAVIERVKQAAGPEPAFEAMFAGDADARALLMEESEAWIEAQRSAIRARPQRAAKKVLGFIPWLFFGGIERATQNDQAWQP